MALGLVVLEHLAATLAGTFHNPCRIRPETFDVSFALDPGRHQYYSTSILQRLERDSDLDARVLGVTACDLYVPVLTFGFGEAQLDTNCAGVSTARLHEQLYGMPPPHHPHPNSSPQRPSHLSLTTFHPPHASS